MIDFKEEFYNILEKNSFENRPSQELIDADERVAAAVWKNNYQAGEYYDSDSGRNRGYHNYENYAVMAPVFEKYMDNKDFWEKNLILRTDISILLNEDFQTHFSKVWHNYIDSPEKLLSIIKENKSDVYRKKDYLTLLDKLPDFKDELLSDSQIASYIVQKDANWYVKLDNEKKHNINIIKNAITSNEKMFAHLPEDKKNNEFIIAFALDQHPTIYTQLSDEQRKNPEFIKVLMNYKYYSQITKIRPEDVKNIFNVLPEEYRHDYLIVVAPRVAKFSANVVASYDSQYHETLLKAKPELIKPANENFNSVFKATINTLLRQNIIFYSQYTTDKSINHFIVDVENINAVRSQLENYIKEYKASDDIPKALLTVISVDPALTQQLETNASYILSSKIAQYKKQYKKSATYDEFVDLVKEVIEAYSSHKLNYNEAEKITSSLFIDVSHEVKKELRLPQKNIFKILKATLLHDKITNDLNNDMNDQESEEEDRLKIKI
jgi:hypothetical protein